MSGKQIEHYIQSQVSGIVDIGAQTEHYVAVFEVKPKPWLFTRDNLA